jgi:hypothetical protein
LELKCLGGCEGVAEVTEKVVATRNYKLLERLLAVVQTKEKSWFDVKSCRTLIGMVTSKNAHNMPGYVRTIFSGLSSSYEPDTELYGALYAAVARFGHGQFTDVIAKFLSDEKRKGQHTLSIFLQRAAFVLELNERFKNECGYVEKVVAYFTSFGQSTPLDLGESVNETISMMISQHGWEAMGPVVLATLDFMHRKSSPNRSLAGFCNQTVLLWQVLDHPYDFMQVCYAHFAEDFSKHLCRVPTSALGGDKQRTLVKAFSYIMANGNTDDHRRFGKWAISSDELFTTFLASVSYQSASLEFDTQGFLLDVLNKCLVHNSITSNYSWRSLIPTIINGNQTPIQPSLHLRLIFAEYPDLPILEDGDKRLTLHHASDSNTASCEAVMDVFEANPKAASVRDPVTSLYPFMLAGMHGNSDAAFKLLLVNPSLVIGDTQTVDTRKRKRRLSADNDS